MKLALLRIAGLPFDAVRFQAPESASIVQRLLDHEFELGLDFIVAGLERLLAAGAPDASGDNVTGYDKIIG